MSPYTAAVLISAAVMLPAWIDSERANRIAWYRPFKFAAMVMIFVLLTPEFAAAVAHIVWHQILVGWGN